MSFAIRLTELLRLQKRPVAVAFRDEAPAGMARIDEPAPSGCSYWKFAAGGHSFYTEAEDHFGCPVGSHTHGVDLPEEKAKELEGLIGTMVELEYLDPDEVAGIATRHDPFGVALYGPADEAEFEADVIVTCGNARQMMLLAEAAHAAGVATDASLVGRPTCAAIPAAMQSGHVAANLGCIGNRVYTELADDEMYFILPASRLEGVVEKLSIIVHANGELEKFHAARV